MSLADTLLGSAIGYGARVIEGLLRRRSQQPQRQRPSPTTARRQEGDPALEQEFDRRLLAEIQRRQAEAQDAQPTEEQEGAALNQELDARILAELQRRQEALGQLDPSVMAKISQLWDMARGNEQVFLQWLGQLPDTAMRQALQDPIRLQQIIGQLQQQSTPPAEQTPQGLEEPPITSSNVAGFNYNPMTQELFVQFHGSDGGSVYKYGGVPRQVAQAFMTGSASARTNGQNRYGRWFKNKNPSLGAAHWQYIRDNFPYQRVS